MAPRKGKKKASVISVDFTGVESSGNCKEGRQIGTVLEVESRTSDSSGNDYLNWKIKGQGGNVFHTTSLQPQALWNLRSTLEACGQEVPEGPLDIDLTELVDLTMGMEIEHEVYQGKKRAVIIDLFPEEELDGEEDEEEDDSEESTDSDDGEGDEVTYEDVMEMDKDELLELAEEEGVKVTATAKKKLDTLREFIADKLELEPSDEEDEEDEEEDDITADDVNEMDKDELLELAEENDIKVLAKVKKSVAKLRAFLIEKLELEEGDDEDEEEEDDEPAPKKKGSTTVKKGATVKFEDDGETLKGKVKSVNKAEGFAVILVDGEEWEVELDDIQ